MPEKKLRDFIGSFPSGVDSGVDPLLLPKNRAAFASNATMRGDFVKTRPAFRKIEVSGAVYNLTDGVFQAACYYNPAAGSEFIMLAVGGKLYRITISGNSATASEVSLPDALNAASPKYPNWMWQADKWLIWNDGVKLPMFYDGATARRSQGEASTILASIISSYIVPPVGQTVNAQISTEYKGPHGVAVLLSGINGNATYTLASSFNSETAAGRVPASFDLISTPQSGDSIRPGTPFNINNRYQGMILSAEMGGNPISAWPEKPVASTADTNASSVTNTDRGNEVVGGIVSVQLPSGLVLTSLTGGQWPVWKVNTTAARFENTIVDVTQDTTKILGGVASVVKDGVTYTKDLTTLWPADRWPDGNATNDNTITFNGVSVGISSASVPNFPPPPQAAVAWAPITVTPPASTLRQALPLNGCTDTPGGYWLNWGDYTTITTRGDTFTIAGYQYVATAATVVNGFVTSITAYPVTQPTATINGSIVITKSFEHVTIHSSQLLTGTPITCGGVQMRYQTEWTQIGTIGTYNGPSGTTGRDAAANQFTVNLNRPITIPAGTNITVGSVSCKVVTGGTNATSLVLTNNSSAAAGSTIPIYVPGTTGSVITFTLNTTKALPATAVAGHELSVDGARMYIQTRSSSTSFVCRMKDATYKYVNVPFYVPAGTGDDNPFSITLTKQFTGAVNDDLLVKWPGISTGAYLRVTGSPSADKFTIPVVLTADPGTQSIPFWVSGDLGRPNIVTLTMTASPGVDVNAGDKLLANMIGKDAGDVALVASSDSVGNKIYVQVENGVGQPIQFWTSGTPLLKNLVVNTTNNAVNAVGIYPLDNGRQPTPTNYSPILISNIGGTLFFLLVTGEFAPSVGQILEVESWSSGASPTSRTNIVYCSAISSPTTAGLSYYLQLKNQTDVPGATIPSGVSVRNIPEIPVSTIGAYGHGRVWVSMPGGKSFLAGDLVGSSSGSFGQKYADAVLKVSQNRWLAGAGTFTIPGAGDSITAMKFVSALDASLGQGPLQVFTNNRIFSCNVTSDIQEWASLNSPILTESLIGSGAAGSRCVVQESSDILFRTTDGGFRSMLIARLDYNKWGNTPISNEISRSLQNDNPEHYKDTSCVSFDNRFIAAINGNSSGRGVYKNKLVALNFDPTSNLQSKSQSIWEGEWSGINVLDFVTGFFNGVQRCFAICLDGGLNSIELVEITRDGELSKDNGNESIAMTIESPVLFNESAAASRAYKRLADGELSVDEITNDVTVSAYYRFDQSKKWIHWHTGTIRASVASENGFRPRIGLGSPLPTGADSINNRPNREGYSCQVKLVFSERCRLVSARFMAYEIDEPEFAKPLTV